MFSHHRNHRHWKAGLRISSVHVKGGPSSLKTLLLEFDPIFLTVVIVGFVIYCKPVSSVVLPKQEVLVWWEFTCVCQESVGGKCSTCTFMLLDPCNKLTVCFCFSRWHSSWLYKQKKGTKWEVSSGNWSVVYRISISGFLLGANMHRKASFMHSSSLFKLPGCEHFHFQVYVNFVKKLRKPEDFHSEALFSECVGRGKRSE